MFYCLQNYRARRDSNLHPLLSGYDALRYYGLNTHSNSLLSRNAGGRIYMEVALRKADMNGPNQSLLSMYHSPCNTGRDLKKIFDRYKSLPWPSGRQRKFFFFFKICYRFTAKGRKAWFVRPAPDSWIDSGCMRDLHLLWLHSSGWKGVGNVHHLWTHLSLGLRMYQVSFGSSLAHGEQTLGLMRLTVLGAIDQQSAHHEVAPAKFALRLFVQYTLKVHCTLECIPNWLG